MRRRLLALVTVEGAWLTGTAFAGTLALGMVADHFFDLPRPVRILALAVATVFALTILFQRVLLTWNRLPRHDALALYLERQYPAFRSRLISASQLGSQRELTPESQAFVQRLTQEAQATAHALSPSQVVPPDTLLLALRRWLPLWLVIAIALPAGWPRTGILLQRAFLSEIPLPRQTRITLVTGSLTVGRGEDVRLSALAEGRLPTSGRLTLRHPSGRTQSLPLESDPSRPGTYERVIANVPTSFQYQFRLNDAESETFDVRVLPRPVATNVVFRQILPAYTGWPTQDLAPGNLTLLRGSRLEITATASQPLTSAVVRIVGPDSDLPSTLNPANPAQFHAVVTANDPSLRGFGFQLVDQEGIRSLASTLYAVEVVADRPPQIRLTLPVRREELATPRGTVRLAFEARDDFGIGSLRLHYLPAGAPTNAAATVELDLEESPATLLRRQFLWTLATLQPPVAEGNLIEFWIEAEDRNDQDGPGRGRTERHLIRVVSEAEKRADLLGRATDAISRLGEVAQGQERLNESLGRIILAKPDQP